jgi:DNA helicase II / ATP-dependent DNA helicase PcrA
MEDIYSVLIYERKVTKETYHIIFSYIEKGTKIYYLTKSKEEQLNDITNSSEKEKLSMLKNKYLLSIDYDICLNETEEYAVFEDGNIPEHIKQQLKDKSFNLEQYEIEHLPAETHIIVKAGAGTGKTKTMIDRSIFLRHKRYSSFREMVMITFTNKSAIQMKTKLSERLEEYYNITKDYKYLDWIDELSEMRIQTIHSFSKGFIEEFGDRINIDKNSKIKSLTYEKYKIIEEVINDYRFAYLDNYNKFRYIPQYKLIKAIRKIESHLTSRGIDILDNFELIDWGIDENNFNHMLSYLLKNLCIRLKEYKDQNSYIEINDLVSKLREFVNLERTFTDSNIKYIMIDEFQDTDSIQVQFLIWLINNFKCKSFVVGDIKQSIYRFRGADYTAFIQFEQELRSKKLSEEIIKKTLKVNYRSDKRLIERLNRFFTNVANIDTAREETKYFTFNEDDKLEAVKEYKLKNVMNSFFKSQESIKDEIADYIGELVRNNEVQDEIGVLLRTNNDLEDIVDRLEGKGMVCKKEISGSFYRSIAVKEFYVMLKALLYPKVYINQYAFINSSFGFGISNEEIFNNFSTSTNYLEKLLENHPVIIKLKEYRDRLQKEPFMIILKEIVDCFEPHLNYGIKRLRERTDIKDEEDAISKMRTNATNYELNLMHLFTILDSKFSNMEADILDVEGFLNNMIQTDNIEDEKMLSFNHGKYDLTCMTIHKAKGLEFDNVVIPKTNNGFLNRGSEEVHVFVKISDNNAIKVGYLVNLEELEAINNIYESCISEENKEIIAEEIRLLYVALTRAKKSIHVNKNRIVSDSGKINNWMQLFERGKLLDENF